MSARTILISFFEKLKLGWYVLTRRIQEFKKGRHCLVHNLVVEYPEKIFTDCQIDGEYHFLKTNKMGITVIQNGLQVIVP